MGNLILVRHGESTGNRERIFGTEPHSLPLTERGYQQARDVAAKIGKLFKAEHVVASYYLRAHETGRVIAEALHLPLEIEPKLHEREVGVLKGQAYEAAYKMPDYNPENHWTWAPEGGESFVDVMNRVGPILDRLAKTYLGRDVVVVSHGGVMKALWAHVTGDWETTHTPPNCGIVLIEHSVVGYSLPQVVGDVASASHEGG
jgi:broad specificity phosphatase PhoE